jgi:hypothetical protein
MFIESGASDDALRQEGHVEFEYLAFTVDMALLTEGASGRLASINISLLTEGNVQTQATNAVDGIRDTIRERHATADECVDGITN